MPVSTQRVVFFIFIQLFFITSISQSFAESVVDTPVAIEPIKEQVKEPAKITHSIKDEKQLIKLLGNIKTVTSEFIQKLYTTDSSKPQITEGRLLVAGGDKFRLEYTKPYEQLYVANGKEFLFYDVDLEQITIKPQPEELANTPAMILSNPVVFIKKYFVTLNKDSDMEEYILNARNETSAYNKVLLSFKDTRLTTMIIEDSFGQETELNFKSMIYNKRIPESTFNYKPPKGIDVIRSTAQEMPKTKFE